MSSHLGHVEAVHRIDTAPPRGFENWDAMPGVGIRLHNSEYPSSATKFLAHLSKALVFYFHDVFGSLLTTLLDLSFLRARKGLSFENLLIQLVRRAAMRLGSGTIVWRVLSSPNTKISWMVPAPIAVICDAEHHARFEVAPVSKAPKVAYLAKYPSS